mgnify:CR=1 FL=1
MTPSGHERLEAPIYCVLTRIQLRRISALPLMLYGYLQVRRQARNAPRLVRSAFLLRDLRTFFILSIWEGEEGILTFASQAPVHTKVARWAFSWAAHGLEGPEIWSTEWRIWAASNNVNWNEPPIWADLLRGHRPTEGRRSAGLEEEG